MKTRTSPAVHELVSTRLPNRFGDFVIHCYGGTQDDKQHLALVKGDVSGREEVLARVHSECLTGDVFGSQRCDCGQQLELALSAIGAAECGVLLYLRQEGRGIGLVQKLRAYNLQDEGLDTVEANLRLGHQADERDYYVAARILEDLGVKSVRLMTNNPAKLDELSRYGIPIGARVPIEAPSHPENVRYLRAKVEKMAHLLSFERKPANPPPFSFLQPLFERLAGAAQSASHRLFVTLSHAQSLDGATAPSTGAEAGALAEVLRNRHDAVLSADGDGLRLVVRTGAGRTMMVADGADFPTILDEMARQDVRSVLVEGDAGFIGRWLDQDLADYCVITIVPRFLGSPGGGATRASIADCRYQPLGADLIVYGPLSRDGSERTGISPQ